MRWLVDTWEKLSQAGISQQLDPREYKKEVTINKIWLLFTVVILICIPSVIPQWQLLLQVDASAYANHIYYVIPYSIASAFGVIIYWLKVKWHNHIGTKVMMYHGAQSTILALGVMAGPAVKPDLYLYLLFPLPFFFFSERHFKVAVYACVTNVFATVSIYLYWTYFEPLLPFYHKPIIYFVYFANVVAVSTVFILSTYYFWRENINAEQKLSEEREKSENLLLNILPKKVADELKERGSSQPIKFERASVLFTDFVGFTEITRSMRPEELIEELDQCFSYFDAVTQKYGLEKLKTIGDSFMCAGGIPEPNTTNALDCALAALEIQGFMQQMKEIKDTAGFPYWELRLGISTGPVVAGVIGEKKFAFDVWGDTVNIASRMESSGAAGKINISQNCFEHIHEFFNCERHEDLRMKDDVVPMYFVKGLKRQYSGDGRVPNDRFHTVYKSLAGMNA